MSINFPAFPNGNAPGGPTKRTYRETVGPPCYTYSMPNTQTYTLDLTRAQAERLTFILLAASESVIVSDYFSAPERALASDLYDRLVAQRVSNL